MRHTKATMEKIAELEGAGYTIIDGNDWKLNTRKKYAGREIIRVAQTNSRLHGKCINTVWAIKNN